MRISDWSSDVCSSDLFASIAGGDFGISLSDRTPTVELIAGALPQTLRLAAASFGLGLLLGIPLGIVSALYRHTAIDRFVMGFAVFGFSIPNFFLGILLILLFSLHPRLLPRRSEARRAGNRRDR